MICNMYTCMYMYINTVNEVRTTAHLLAALQVLHTTCTCMCNRETYAHVLVLLTSLHCDSYHDDLQPTQGSNGQDLAHLPLNVISGFFSAQLAGPAGPAKVGGLYSLMISWRRLQIEGGRGGGRERRREGEREGRKGGRGRGGKKEINTVHRVITIKRVSLGRAPDH